MTERNNSYSSHSKLNKTAKQKREIVTISSSKELELSAGITPLYLAFTSSTVTNEGTYQISSSPSEDFIYSLRACLLD